MKHLAVDEDAWNDTRIFHSPDMHHFKRCIHVGVIKPLSALESLTIVGSWALWRDGNQFWNEPNLERDWPWDGENDWHELSEAKQTDEEENAKYSERFTVGEEMGTTQFTIENEATRKNDPGADDREFIISTNEEDLWYCGFVEGPRVCKPNSSDGQVQRFTPSGHCGLALIDFGNISDEPKWGNLDASSYETRQIYEKDFNTMRQDHSQWFEYDEEESNIFVD